MRLLHEISRALHFRMLVTGAGLSLGLACSSESDDPKGDAQFPSDVSASGIAEFLDSESYLSWTGDAAPRAGEVTGNVHGDEIRVFFNDEAVTGGNGTNPPVGTAVVKQLYQSGALVGVAASFKTSASEWVYYCDSNTNLCSGRTEPENPVFGANTETGCGFCHGDQLFSPLPE